MTELSRYGLSAGATTQHLPAPTGWPEGMTPSSVNNAAREFMAGVARHMNALEPIQTATFSAQVFSLTYNREITAGELQGIYSFIADEAATGSASLNINGLGAKKIVGDGGVDLSNVAIRDKQPVICAYDATNDRYQMISPSTPPANQSGFHATIAAAQVSVTGNVWTQIIHSTEAYDFGSDYSAAAGVFTAPEAGLYLFNGSCEMDEVPNLKRNIIRFVCSTAGNFNGTGDFNPNAGATKIRTHGSVTVQLIKDETVQMQTQHNDTTDDLPISGNAAGNYFTGTRLA